MATAEEYRETWQPAEDKTKRGFVKAKYLSEEQIDAIFEHAREGIPISTACREEGTSVTQLFRRLKREPGGMARWEEVKEAAAGAYREYLRDKAFQQVEKGNYKALRDQMLAHLPEFDVLRTSRLQIGNMSGEDFRMMAMRQLGPMSDEDLARLIELFERSQAEVIELPRAVDG